MLSVIEREKVSFLQIVGDSFARPILDEMDTGSYDLSTLFIILSGGAPLNSTLKERFLEHLPNAMILDGMGSSEGGGQMTQVVTAGSDVTTGTFTPSPGTCIVSEDFTRVLGRAPRRSAGSRCEAMYRSGTSATPRRASARFPSSTACGTRSR